MVAEPAVAAEVEGVVGVAALAHLQPIPQGLRLRPLLREQPRRLHRDAVRHPFLRPLLRLQLRLVLPSLLPAIEAQQPAMPRPPRDGAPVHALTDPKASSTTTSLMSS